MGTVKRRMKIITFCLVFLSTVALFAEGEKISTPFRFRNGLSDEPEFAEEPARRPTAFSSRFLDSLRSARLSAFKAIDQPGKQSSHMTSYRDAACQLSDLQMQPERAYWLWRL